MLRMIRIVGLIAFAVLMSYSANALYRMYKSGELFEQYNYARKSNITLFAVSAVAVIGISGYEVRRSRKIVEAFPEHRMRRSSSGSGRDAEENKNSCIYSGRETFDELPNRSTPGYHGFDIARKLTKTEVWMKMLRIICLVIPFVNLVIFATLYVQNFGNQQAQWVFPLMAAFFVSIGVMAAVGVFNKLRWGLSCGYLLAIINLALFPIGTAMALFLLICLVGAASAFARPKRRRARTG